MQAIHFVTTQGGTVYLEAGAIPEGTGVTIEGFDHPPMDANGVWALTALIALNVNGGALNTPAAICIPLDDLPATATFASWTAGDNGGFFTPVPTYRMGTSLCTSTSMTGVFGLVDGGYFK
jgi:hypothetical protein